MDYQDFVLQLDRAPEGQGFLARVLRSSAGEAEEPFVNPLSPGELDVLWRTAHATRQASLERGLRDLGAKASLAASNPVAAELSLEDLGGRLFQALFRGPVRSCWSRSLAESERLPERGLRLKLQLDVSDPLLAPLAELPWECLFSPEQGGFLGLQRNTPILRHLRLPLPVGQPPPAQPLRILTVSAQPRSLPALALEDEGTRIAAALGALPGVETLALHNPTIEELRDTLLLREFHVLHFMGHGGFDRESGQGVVFFTAPDKSPLPVSGTLLASHLAGLHSLRLVFVNACETARGNAQAPFAGVAAAILRAGLPAVIAMQRPIQDGSALEFSRTVYRRLAAGDPIDAAVTEGRLAIARGRGALLEWGTPVLFLRAEDGRLFDIRPFPTINPPLSRPPDDSPVPTPVRPSRSVGAMLLAGGLAAGLAIGALQWLREIPQPVTKEAMTSDQPPPTTDLNPMVTDHSSPPPEQETPKKKVHTETIRHRDPPEEKPDEPVSSRLPSRSSYKIGQGSSTSISSLNTEVGANFYETQGHAFARFWISPPGEGTLQQPPVVGPGSIEFPAQNGTYRLDVLSLDLEGKQATVKLSLIPKSS
ncbi:MAG TPA: CHAT domain-containing protein [Thermoanaerobaculia bacterium]|jgi:hypothetical protein